MPQRLVHTQRQHRPKSVESGLNLIGHGTEIAGHVPEIIGHALPKYAIALTVDEQDPGHFYWVLIEADGDARLYDELRACQEPFGTYMEALEAGFAELRRMVNWRDGLRG